MQRSFLSRVFFSLFLLFVFSAVSLGQSPGQMHCFKDSLQREKVRHRIELRKKQYPHGALFKGLSSSSLTQEEREALEFLYAYMPLADLADMPYDYYLRSVRSTLEARCQMPWGKRIPDEIFRHFVLPLRVNNENLDEARILLFPVLKKRVAHLSMYEAVLEVNHWCHEWVTYSPSNARTLSPLSTIRSLVGRCGEESTLTVAALRAVGIPARQVYTPRWAHTDDNHAWVEVWVDGGWHFLGACEPAPILNMSWFNSSVKRAMFVHSLVFGDYNGEEEVVRKTDLYTEVNCTPIYAPVEKMQVRVQDANHQPVEGAEVAFCVYNYAEFYPIVKKSTNGSGEAEVSVGKGDLMIWATHQGQVAFGVCNPQNSPLILTLQNRENLPDEWSFEIVPPKNSSVFLDVTDLEMQRNNDALIVEDSIRKGLQDALFITPEAALSWTRKMGIQEEQRMVEILIKSRGNHTKISRFFEGVSASKREDAVRFLMLLTEKDWQDTPTATLQYIFRDMPAWRDDFFGQYVLNPRIENEYLSAYRRGLRRAISLSLRRKFHENPSLIVDWMNERMVINDELNSERVVISPLSVLKTQRADLRSARLFYVALARSLDIASRINSITQEVEYSVDHGKSWKKVEITPHRGTVTEQELFPVQLRYTPTKTLPNPSYYSHFSIAKIENSGSLSTQYFNENEVLTYKDRFAEPLLLPRSEYYLISGNRLASGKVSGRMKKFRSSSESGQEVELIFPHKEGEVSVLGSLNTEEHYQPVQSVPSKSILSTTGRGYFVLVLLKANEEPSNHLLKDLEKVSDALNEWGRPFLFLFPDASEVQRFRASDFPRLPQHSYWGVDSDKSIQSMIARALELPTESQTPWVIVADSFGRIVFIRQGYNIGTGEELLSILPHLE